MVKSGQSFWIPDEHDWKPDFKKLCFHGYREVK